MGRFFGGLNWKVGLAQEGRFLIISLGWAGAFGPIYLIYWGFGKEWVSTKRKVFGKISQGKEGGINREFSLEDGLFFQHGI